MPEGSRGSRPPSTANPGTQSQSQGVRAPTTPSQNGPAGEHLVAVVQDCILGISHCNSIGELLRFLPVPVQPCSRDILENVFQASQKLGAAESLVGFWKDQLRSSNYTAVAQLNSLRAPIVQVSKEALGPNDGGLSAMNLDTILAEAKRNALTQMILIKEREIANLRDRV